MNYIENIFICLAAPIVISVFCIRGKGRPMMFFVLSGMTVCLLSSYISTFLTASFSLDYVTASITVTPIVEEVMKFLPLLFYLLVFEPEKEVIPSCVIMLVSGFATFENVCYLIQNGTSDFFPLLIRGFGTGAMHIICGVIIYTGITSFWDRLWLRTSGCVCLLAVSIVYHGIYNMLVLQEGFAAIIGYLIPLLSAFVSMIKMPVVRE